MNFSGILFGIVFLCGVLAFIIMNNKKPKPSQDSEQIDSEGLEFGHAQENPVVMMQTAM